MVGDHTHFHLTSAENGEKFGFVTADHMAYVSAFPDSLARTMVGKGESSLSREWYGLNLEHHCVASRRFQLEWTAPLALILSGLLLQTVVLHDVKASLW